MNDPEPGHFARDTVFPEAGAEDQQVEGALRPQLLEEFVGQERVREQLTLILRGAQQRGRAPDHVLMSGPPGPGKTTLALIIAAELGAPMRTATGPRPHRPRALAVVLSTLP